MPRFTVHNGRPGFALMSNGEIFLELVRAHKRKDTPFKHNWIAALQGEAIGRGWMKRPK